MNLESISEAQALGLDPSHLVEISPGCLIHEAIEAPLSTLYDKCRADGCVLSVASGYRSFDRQLAIFNAKARGERAVLDDAGRPVEMSGLSEREQLFAILRFSALPGASRHHWGTDIDVYDAAAIEPDYRVRLTYDECAQGGVFGRLHQHLDSALTAGGGFYRPYDCDRGGVAPEPWHLSYGPLARRFEQVLTRDLLGDQLAVTDIELKSAILNHLDAIYARFVCLQKRDV